MSLKVAQIDELQNKKSEAKKHYTRIIKLLEEKREKEPTDRDVTELLGLTNNAYVKIIICNNVIIYILPSNFSYGKSLLKHGKYAEAADRLKHSREAYVEIQSTNSPDFVNILNDIAMACLHVRQTHFNVL